MQETIQAPTGDEIDKAITRIGVMSPELTLLFAIGARESRMFDICCGKDPGFALSCIHLGLEIARARDVRELQEMAR